MQRIELDHDKYSAYLNQHLVAADAGVKAFKAAADTWEGTPLQAVFEQLHRELEQSHDKVKALIERLGYDVSMTRNLVAGVAHVAGRLNPLNFTRNSDGLMTQMEFDALAAAVRAQQMMWETLVVLSDVDDRLDRAEMQAMVDLCEDQRARVVKASAETAVERFTAVPG
ncbi:hypothetical protein [Tessaracoccus flavus]|jgi:hypothetical protein|uniref:Uncharacterized protein n=1 Tax=Tessaracoccus flavus TaxID=1610493 RepID=A0A1Q2CFP6_9ACTN|nr:hypothetical protein [Tessaracoccus flavus]AQP44939.1 hypothetical protein RPIT_09200 [Tessaracoccus flavus]SDY99305.1 hypothetical protein SAMN05428934_107152 [Tessaracoccus flavus]